jgi:hypothetical protein
MRYKLVQSITSNHLRLNRLCLYTWTSWFSIMPTGSGAITDLSNFWALLFTQVPSISLVTLDAALYFAWPAFQASVSWSWCSINKQWSNLASPLTVPSCADIKLHVVVLLLLCSTSIEVKQPGDLLPTQWTVWSGCSVTCGNGVYRRYLTTYQSRPLHRSTNSTGHGLLVDKRPCRSNISCPG